MIILALIPQNTKYWISCLGSGTQYVYMLNKNCLFAFFCLHIILSFEHVLLGHLWIASRTQKTHNQPTITGLYLHHHEQFTSSVVNNFSFAWWLPATPHYLAHSLNHLLTHSFATQLAPQNFIYTSREPLSPWAHEALISYYTPRGQADNYYSAYKLYMYNVMCMAPHCTCTKLAYRIRPGCNTQWCNVLCVWDTLLRYCGLIQYSTDQCLHSLYGALVWPKCQISSVSGLLSQLLEAMKRCHCQ